jgi:hypothetical protein
MTELSLCTLHLVILTQQPSEPSSSTDARWRSWTTGAWKRLRAAELQPAVGAATIVVLDIVPKDCVQVARSNDQHPIEAFGLDSLHPCSVKALARRALIGVRIMSTPSDRKTPSKPPPYFASRSWTRNRTGLDRSSRRIERLRACWVTHAESGRAVHPATWTRLVEISMTRVVFPRFDGVSLLDSYVT